MSESKYSKRMRDALGAWFEFIRVESHATSPGIPDIHWLYLGGTTSGWIETKHSPKTPTKVKYQPQQAPWLTDYARKGGNACTLIFVTEGDVVIFVPGRESIAAQADLSRAHGARRIKLSDPDAWKRLAKLVLGSLT